MSGLFRHSGSNTKKEKANHVELFLCLPEEAMLVSLLLEGFYYPVLYSQNIQARTRSDDTHLANANHKMNTNSPFDGKRLAGRKAGRD